MAYKIIWSPQAIEDLRSLTDFIAQDNPDAAERVGNGLLYKSRYLVDHPHMGRMVPERKQPQIREVIVSPYRLIYRVNERTKSIEIMRIWHAARGEPEV